MVRQHRSLKQKILAKKVAESFTTGWNKPQSEIIKEAGYSPASAENPQIIFGSQGFKDELAKLGFTIDAADMQVKNLLVSGKKEETKLKAPDMIYKRLGGYAPDRTLNVSIKGSVEDFRKDRDIAEKYEAELIKRYEVGTDEEVNPSLDRSEPDKDGNGNPA